jgi:hypothetical protein
MSNFTELLEKGKRRFIDKYLKKRKFDKCEGCSRPTLLIEYKDEKEHISIMLCDYCYTTALKDGLKMA